MSYFPKNKVIPSIKVISKNDPTNIYMSFDKSDNYIIMIRKNVTLTFQPNVTPEYLTDYMYDIMTNIDEKLEVISNMGQCLTDINHLDPTTYKNDLLKLMQLFVYTMHMYV